MLGLGWPGAVVGAANGALGGWRGIYAWRRPAGPLAFVARLDVGVADDGRGPRRPTPWPPCSAAAAATSPSLSRRANRHVYARGFRLRRGFLITIGNAVHGAGERATSSPRRRRVVTDHEDVHVWQGRWFGPLYPLLYGGWMVAGGAVGRRRVGDASARRAVRQGRRDVRLLPQPVRVVGLQPRRLLAAAAQGRRARLAPAGGAAAQRDAAAAGPSSSASAASSASVERLGRLLLRPVAGALDERRAAVVGRGAWPSPRRSPAGRR